MRVAGLQAALESRGLDEVALRGALQLEGDALAHPRFAATPLRDLALRIEGDGTLRPIERRFILRTARFITGQVPVEWNGVVELGPPLCSGHLIDGFRGCTRVAVSRFGA